MIVVIYLLTRSLFTVGFEWRRLAQLVAVLAGVAVAGELLLPTPRPGRPARARRVAGARARRCCC